MSVKLDISLGEAIDKLTILDIKKDKITDSRKIDVENEFEYLLTELKTYVAKYEYYYNILKKTNLKIWELQDTLRSNTSDQNIYYDICDEILNLNDSRYLIKKKMNEVCNSRLKEQKGYSIRMLDIILNCDMNTISILNGAIRYYSFFYDEVNLFSTTENMVFLHNTFNDDPFINIYCIEKACISEISKNDCVSIDNTSITVKLLHSFFNKNNNSANHIYNNTYSNEINDIYCKLGMNVNIFDEYKNFAKQISK
jgi:hypothetical protein